MIFRLLKNTQRQIAFFFDFFYKIAFTEFSTSK